MLKSTFISKHYEAILQISAKSTMRNIIERNVMSTPSPESTPLSTLLTLLESITLPRNILLCVSGSIAAYKALELASTLKKLHINVAVVMSESAKKFITPLSFEAITHIKVLHADTESWENGKQALAADILLESKSLDSGAPESCNHIAYARWAQLCILAPASANSLAKLARGIADTLPIQTLLATNAPILCAPAMNTQMLLCAQTQANLATLSNMGIQIIAPRVGLLACNTTGSGALANIEEVLFALLTAGMNGAVDSGLESHASRNAARFWRAKEVCITGGGASAMIDSVRAITNHSSGLQASALAIALHSLGAKVTLIASAFPLPLPEAIRKIHATSNEDFTHALAQVAQERKQPESEQSLDSGDPRVVLFMAAALVDFAPESAKEHKIKKHDTNSTLQLTLMQKSDVLSSLSESDFVKIGFKAEDNLESALPNALSMLYPSGVPDESNAGRLGKGCEIVCLNTLESNPFGSINNHFTLLNRQSLHDKHTIVQCESDSKLALAYKIAHFVQTTLESTAPECAKS